MDLLLHELEKHINPEWSEDYAEYIKMAYINQWNYGSRYDAQTEQIIFDLSREIGDVVLGEEVEEERKVIQGGSYTLSEDLEYELLMRNEANAIDYNID